MNNDIQAKAIEILSSIYDPEIPISIWELGLIYNLEVKENNDLSILMTMTAPNCPIADSLPDEVKTRLSEIPGIGKIEVNVTFDPPWDMDRLSDAAKMELGMY